MDRIIIEGFDRQGAMSEFTVECLACPIHIMIKDKVRGPTNKDCYCKIIKKDCPWIKTSVRNKNTGEMCTAPSSRIFRKYGFDFLKKNSTYVIGKSHFLFFFYHPDMNCQPPLEMPKRNRFGKIVDPNGDVWEMCHLNGDHWDDRKKNLEWKLRTEHKVTEPNKRRKKEPTTLTEAGIPY